MRVGEYEFDVTPVYEYVGSIPLRLEINPRFSPLIYILAFLTSMFDIQLLGKV